MPPAAATGLAALPASPAAVLGLLAITHLLTAMIPGPNTVLVGHLAASRSRAAGLEAAAGVATATLIWVVVALAGAGLMMREAGAFYHGLRLAGALYLLYAGWRMIRAGLRPAPPAGNPAGTAASGTATAGLRAAGRPFVRGLLTTLTNPKSAIFWTSVFMVILPPAAGPGLRTAAAALVTGQSAAWYGLIALTFSTAPVRASYARAARALDLAAGVVMTGLGLRLAADVQRDLMP